MRNYNHLSMGNANYNAHPSFFFWVKLKTISTKASLNRILQIAYVYTDFRLSTCHFGSSFVIHCNKQDFQSVDQSQLKFFQENGLYEACMNSQMKIEDAEQLIMKDIEIRKIARGQLLAAGKQIHLAKYALMRHMPNLHDFLHYRIFDLSSVEFIIQGLKDSPRERQAKLKDEKRANEEVWQDINQMQFYYQHALTDN